MIAIGMDPGTKSAGFSVVGLNLDTLTFTVHSSNTVFGKDVIRQYGNLTEVNEERYLRNLGYYEAFEELLQDVNPYTVCSESPFMGKFAATFRALTEQITLWRAAISNWDRSQPLHLYSPPAVKKAVGVKGGSNNKDHMTKALQKRTDVIWAEGVTLSELDEHSVDSICVCITHLTHMYEMFKPQLHPEKT